MGFGGEAVEGTYGSRSSLAYKVVFAPYGNLKMFPPPLAETASSLFVSRVRWAVIGKLDSRRNLSLRRRRD